MRNDVTISRKTVISDMSQCEANKSVLSKPQLWRKMNSLCKMSVIAAKLALKAAGISDADIDKDRTGVILATTHGPTESKALFISDAYKYGLRLASPFVFPNTSMNMSAGMIAMELGIRGPNCLLVKDKDHLSAAVDYAADLIVSGKADIVIAGSVHEPKDQERPIEEADHGVEMVVAVRKR